jgi:GNAT superfamily N-acetyltransferase
MNDQHFRVDLTGALGQSEEAVADFVRAEDGLSALVVISAAGVADAGEILTVQRAAYVTEAQLHDSPWLPPLVQTLEELVAELAEVTACLKAVRGHRLVGTVRARVEGPVMRIGRLAVVPDLQGQGIGTRLLTAMQDLAGPQVTTFALFTGGLSEANLKLYRRLSYVETRRELTAAHGELVHLERPRHP